MNKLITISEAVKVSGIPDSTIRDKIKEGILNKYENENSKMCVQKRELLSIIPTVLTIFNQKGGCGKTSLSVLLADYYEKKKIKTLLIDLDEQSSLSKTFLTYEQLKSDVTLYNFFEYSTPLSKIVRKKTEHLDIIPSDIKLTRKGNYDTTDLGPFTQEFYSVFKKYQIVIADCPPGMNAFSRFGLLLANYVLLPFIPEPYNYDGLLEAQSTVNLLKDYLKYLIDYKIVISMQEQRKLNIQDRYIKLVRTEIGDKITKNAVPNFTGIKERGESFLNIFDMFTEDEKGLNKTQTLLNEIDKFIYDERGE